MCGRELGTETLGEGRIDGRNDRFRRHCARRVRSLTVRRFGVGRIFYRLSLRTLVSARFLQSGALSQGRSECDTADGGQLARGCAYLILIQAFLEPDKFDDVA